VDARVTVPPFVTDLFISRSASDKLWSHGIRPEQTDQVLDGAPKFFRQPNGRLRMIGRDFGGRLITLIIEYPDEDGVSDVVTGWPSDRDEDTRYHRPGGRTNV
jgi:hypothetical protein